MAYPRKPWEFRETGVRDEEEKERGGMRKTFIP